MSKLAIGGKPVRSKLFDAYTIGDIEEAVKKACDLSAKSIYWYGIKIFARTQVQKFEKE